MLATCSRNLVVSAFRAPTWTVFVLLLVRLPRESLSTSVRLESRGRSRQMELDAEANQDEVPVTGADPGFW